VRRPLAILVLLAAASAVLGHGASEGLHLHLSPEPAERGAEVRVKIDAEAPVARIEIAFVGGETAAREPKRPARSLVVNVTVPDEAEGDVVNCHAEAVTVRGDLLRASAVLRIEAPPSP